LNLLDIVHRQRNPEPWAEGEKIPWNDPAFSGRMLHEHLSQKHDAASRRFEIIDRHVSWIHEGVLQGQPTSILDLACGPGLYDSRLAGLGHRCLGIDFGPASIAYARQQAAKGGLDCTYVQHDIRTADFGQGHGLAMLIFGEFNVFRPAEVRAILEKAHRALLPGGFLLLEPHTYEVVLRMGQEPSSWYSSASGLFSAEPHLCLQENFWDAEANAAIERYYIVDATTGEVTRHSATIQAYTDDQYRALLEESSFGQVTFYSSLGGDEGAATGDLLAILGRKEPSA